MSELKNLINILDNGDHPGILHVRNPEKLISSLKHLEHSVIGQDDLKNQIADQTMSLIVSLMNDEKEKVRLHTMLCGPPGVGKTTTAVILADIWNAIGYLDFEKKIVLSGGNNNSEYIALLVISLVIIYGFQAFSFLYDKVGIYYLSFVIGFILLLGVAIFILVTYNQTCNEYVYGPYNDASSVITGRETFIQGYMGQSVVETKRFIKNQKGVAIIVDEAYTIVTDDRDTYGIEVLGLINKDMSENPHKRAWIFCGYREDLEKLFKYQKGLKSRFGRWIFETKGYSGTELYHIFCSQLEQNGWKIHPEEINNVKKLIEDNYYVFEAFGRDTENLYTCSKQKNTRNAFYTGELSRYIRASEVEDCIKHMKNNQRCSVEFNNKDTDDKDMMEILKMLHEKKKYR